MENLFDFLDKQENNNTEENTSEETLEARDYIRLNSYVGSRMNTDFRKRNRLDKEVSNNLEFELIEENMEDFFNDKTDDIEIEELTPKFLIVDGSSLLSTSFYATARDLLFAKTDEQKEIAFTKL
ncbi:MAG: hypothetical protein ACRDA3_16490, partial [Peptostreptococcaceae bacterium]